MTAKHSLNPQQLEAVNQLEGPLLVMAGAGSGKTQVVTSRIINLLNAGIAPWAILGLTFTNKAAHEMKERVMRSCSQEVLISTFHGLGARMLRETITLLGYRPGFTIYDAEDSEKVLLSCVTDFKPSDQREACKAFEGMISHAKNNLQGPEEVDASQLDETWAQTFPEVYRRYQQRLREANAVDFNDLLYLPVTILRKFPEVLARYHDRWQFFLIDEFQDTNVAQYVLVELLASKHGNLCVVGDPDQSIYSWRGAHISNILNFPKNYPNAQVINLEQNYRSTNTILQAANGLIGYNGNRADKKLWSNLGEGEKIRSCRFAYDRLEAQFVAEEVERHHDLGVPFREQSIFLRTNFQTRTFEDQLMRKRIPYVIVGGISFYQRREVKDLLAYLRMIHSDSDFISFVRTVNLPKRGIGSKTIERLLEGASQHKMPILEYVAMACGETPIAGLKLSQAQKQALSSYVIMIHKLREKGKDLAIRLLVEAVLEETGYMSILKEDKEEYEDRLANVLELSTKAMEWETSHPKPSLEGFLEELSLKSSVDDSEGETDRVNIMTLHNSKGLEFTIVFMVGMEEGLFPHIRTRGKDGEVEEERRLCYVGMTRAKQRLYLTSVITRFLWGTHRRMPASRFLREIPGRFVISSEYDDSSEEVNYRDAPEAEEVEVPAVSTGSCFKEGDLIFHQQFGVGKVVHTREGSLGLTYEICFSKDQSHKSIVAKYAQLTRLE